MKTYMAKKGEIAAKWHLVDVSDKVLEIYGGIGYSSMHPIERMYRDARSLWLEEGTPTIQRLVIARDFLKKY